MNKDKVNPHAPGCGSTKQKSPARHWASMNLVCLWRRVFKVIIAVIPGVAILMSSCSRAGIQQTESFDGIYIENTNLI